MDRYQPPDMSSNYIEANTGGTRSLSAQDQLETVVDYKQEIDRLRDMNSTLITSNHKGQVSQQKLTQSNLQLQNTLEQTFLLNNELRKENESLRKQIEELKNQFITLSGSGNGPGNGSDNREFLMNQAVQTASKTPVQIPPHTTSPGPSPSPQGPRSAPYTSTSASTSVGASISAVARLTAVVASGDVQGVLLALSAGLPVDTRLENGQTAFSLAVQCGHWELARVLVDSGADVNVRVQGLTMTPALLLAALAGQWEAVIAWADLATDINAQDEEGVTTLTLAAASQRWDVVRTLALRGGAVNHQDKSGASAVHHLIAHSGDLDTLNLLVQAGADLNQPDRAGWSPLSYAHYYRRDGLTDWLRSRGAV